MSMEARRLRERGRSAITGNRSLWRRLLFDSNLPFTSAKSRVDKPGKNGHVAQLDDVAPGIVNPAETDRILPSLTATLTFGTIFPSVTSRSLAARMIVTLAAFAGSELVWPFSGCVTAAYARIMHAVKEIRIPEFSHHTWIV